MAVGVFFYDTATELPAILLASVDNVANSIICRGMRPVVDDLVGDFALTDSVANRHITHGTDSRPIGTGACCTSALRPRPSSSQQ